ncbi:hypothetical protein T439DRAFT_323155 [Meredithblackwellia eburnea MCA 4105]
MQAEPPPPLPPPMASPWWQLLPPLPADPLLPPKIVSPWRANPCQHCGAFLLAEESLSWCCGNGERLLAPLPPLPPILGQLALNPKQASEWSRSLNNSFSMSALGRKFHHLSQSIFSCRVLMNYHLLQVPNAKEVAQVG